MINLKFFRYNMLRKISVEDLNVGPLFFYVELCYVGGDSHFQ
jgi:hypothetical protein